MNFQLERIGTHYGGWVVPIELLALEFGQPVTLSRMADTMLRLTEAGYVPVDLNGWDMTFLRQDVVGAELPENLSAAVRRHA